MLKNKLVKFELDQSNDTEVYLLSLSPLPSQASQNFVTFSPFKFVSIFAECRSLGTLTNLFPPNQFHILDECKRMMIDLNQLSSAIVKVFGHGTLPVCFSYSALHLWYNDDSQLADNIFFHSTMSFCNYGTWQIHELVGGHFRFGYNKSKKDPLFKDI